MDELPQDELQAMTDTAVAPYLSFDHLFKGQGRARSGTQGWMRSTHQFNNARQMPHAEQMVHMQPTIVASIMALQFRSGYIAIKAEIHDAEDGEILESLDVGTIVSFFAYQGKYFWPALMAYITESEDLVKENQGKTNRTGEVLRLCQMLFERHLRKYADSLPTEETLEAARLVNHILDNRPPPQVADSNHLTQT
jgi:hypothetical protein